MPTFIYTLKSVLKLMTVVVVLFVLVSSSYGQEIKYTDNWGPAGFSYSRSNTTGIEVNYSLTDVFLNDENIGGTTMKVVGVPGIFLPNDAGMPDLPGAGKYIAIPTGTYVTWKITSSRVEKISNIEIAPAPVLPLDNDPNPMIREKNIRVYSQDAYYPESPVMISERTTIRGVDAIVLGITPFQYNPVTKELLIYRDIKVELSFIGGNGKFGDETYRSRWFEPILQDAFLNYESLPKIDFDKINKEKLTGYEYVIIRPNSSDHAQWADSLKNFRISQGIKTTVVSLAEIGGNTVSAIETWVNNAYNTWQIKPVAICLLGDYGTDANVNIISILQTHPAGYPAYPSDNYYADVNGDEMPEIVFSRIVASTASQLQLLVGKQMYYERNPVTTAGYYANPITALGWQTERWFQLCSEIVGGFWKKVQGRTPVRVNAIYSGTPGSVWSSNSNTPQVVAYFGPAGKYYIPLTPDSLGGWSGGTAAMVNNAINNGAFILQHRDHGAYTLWGEPSYSNTNVDQLTNANKMTFVYSINCETGAYQYSSGDCLVERFIKHTYNSQYAGAVGAVAPSEVSYSFVNDAYTWGMYDNMWSNFMPDTMISNIPERGVKPAFGAASGRYFLKYSNWPYNTSDKLVTYRLFHMFGDAFLTLFTAVPQTLSVTLPPTIASGVTSVTVTATAGAFIALTLNGEIIGTATGTGIAQIITIPGTQLPGQTIKVVATKQNYYRWEGTISVVPSAGPYVLYLSSTINDASPLGNGNGLMDYGETNKLNLKLKNTGTASSVNTAATLRCSDTYITITDSTENYGTIAAGDSVLRSDAFSCNISNNIPDGREIQFTVIATNGTDIWTSYFTITAHSPVLRYVSYTIADSSGNNNGFFDPGETINLKPLLTNTGSSTAVNVIGILSENSPYVTINSNNRDYGTLNPADSVSKSYGITSLLTTPPGTVIDFVIVCTGNLGITCQDTFSATIGNNTAIIGTGTSSLGYPYYTYYMDSRTLMLYKASEIIATGVSAPGLITEIGFDVITHATQTMNGFNIKMKNYTDTAVTAWIDTGWTTVYSGTYAVPGAGWQMITLQTPFLWNGTSNLIIEICFDNTTYTTNTTVRGFSPVDGKIRHHHVDNGVGCSLTSTTAVSYRPNIKMIINSVEQNLTLNLKAYLEGFWNGTTHVSDTAMIYLANSTSPYSLVDSQKAVLSSSGTAEVVFTNASAGNYYVVIKHRNHLETWSALSQTFVADSPLSYDFTSSQTQAYGNNLIYSNGAWCMFGGDINRDGFVDGADMAILDNDLYNYVSGYVVSDVNGDQFVDGADMAILDNNLYNYIGVVRPGGKDANQKSIILKPERKENKTLWDVKETKRQGDKVIRHGE